MYRRLGLAVLESIILLSVVFPVSAEVLEIKLRKNMPYQDAKKILINPGWQYASLPAYGYRETDKKVRSECFGEVKICNEYHNGDNLYGIVHEGSGTGQGWFVSSTSIYAKVNGSLREVLPLLTTSENNSGSGGGHDGKALTDWDSKMTIQPGTKGFFNILVERKGIREGKPFSERELFKFNGQKYVSTQL